MREMKSIMKNSNFEVLLTSSSKTPYFDTGSLEFIAILVSLPTKITIPKILFYFWKFQKLPKIFPVAKIVFVHKVFSKFKASICPSDFW